MLSLKEIILVYINIHTQRNGKLLICIYFLTVWRQGRLKKSLYLFFFFWRESFKTVSTRLFRVSVKPENLKQSDPVVMAIVYNITVRLTFLTHSFRMGPNFQGLPWYEFDGLVEGELLIRFCWIDNLESLLWLYFQSLGTNLLQVFIAYEKRSTVHFLT